MLYSCTCRPLAVDWLLLPLKVNFFLFYLCFILMLTGFPAQQSPVLAISWIREEHVRFGCHAWLRFCLWNWSCWWFFFSGAPIACVPRPITFVFDLVRCVKICRSWDSNSRPLAKKRENVPYRPTEGTISGLCLSPSPGHLMSRILYAACDCDKCRLRLMPSADCILSDTRL